jgi:pilus assembly protein Flp/PilA
VVCRKSFVEGYLSAVHPPQVDEGRYGATAIEYTLIAALISVAAITAMSSIGGKVSNVLGNVANAMT